HPAKSPPSGTARTLCPGSPTGPPGETGGCARFRCAYQTSSARLSSISKEIQGSWFVSKSGRLWWNGTKPFQWHLREMAQNWPRPGLRQSARFKNATQFPANRSPQPSLAFAADIAVVVPQPGLVPRDSLALPALGFG